MKNKKNNKLVYALFLLRGAAKRVYTSLGDSRNYCKKKKTRKKKNSSSESLADLRVFLTLICAPFHKVLNSFLLPLVHYCIKKAILLSFPSRYKW